MIVSFPDHVRFSGEGFLALAAGEKAPFGATFAKDRVRVVVPLQRAASRTGDLKVEFYAIGPMEIEWQIATVRSGSLAETTASQKMWIDVISGTPRPIVQDPFATDPPRHIVDSLSGAYQLAVFDGHFKVFDRATRAEVYAAEGADPTFSPTSRFLTYFGRNVTVATVVDLYAEKVVLQIGEEGWAGRGSWIQAFAWSPGDAYLLVGYEAAGALEFAPMLVDRGSWYGQHSCGACSPWEDILVRLDVDNSRVRIADKELVFTDQSASLLHNWSFESVPEPDPADILTSPEGDPKHDDKVAWAINGEPRYSVNTYDDGHLTEHPRAKSMLATDTSDGSLLGRGVVSLREANEINLSSRASRRLSDLGLKTTAGPSLQRDHVAFEANLEFAIQAGSLAQKHGLLNSEAAAHVDNAVLQLGTEGEVCASGARFGGVEANVWSWRNGSVFYQVVQFLCVMSTDQEPDGMVALVWHDGKAAHSINLAVPVFVENPEQESSEHVAGLPIAPQQPVEIKRVTDTRIAVLSTDGNLVLYDVASRSTAAVLNNVVEPLTVHELSLSDDGRHLIQLNPDGRLFIYDVERSSRVLSGIFVDDEIAIYDDQLRFEATPEGARFINVKFPGDSRLYSLDQFGNRLSSPGLIKDTLAQKTIAARVELDIPPRLSAALIATIEGADITVNGHDAVGADIIVYEDGIARWNGKMPEAGQLQVNVPLQPESRWLAIQAIDANGIKSAAQVFPIEAEHRAPSESRLFVLGIGTDVYDDPRLSQLSFAVADAQNFATAFASAGTAYYGSVQATVIADSRSLRTDLTHHLRRLAKEADDTDTVFLHIAGHGVVDGSGKLFLADQGTDMSDLHSSALSWDQLAAELASVKARVFVFLDACHSGAAGIATNDDAVERLNKEDTLSFAVIAASKGRQLSFEGPAYGGGLFTASLIRAFADRRGTTETNGNGIIELSELYGAMKADVVRKTNGLQTPWIASSNFVGEVPLY